MSYVMYAACFTCGKPFGFNPHLVPSIRDRSGELQPVCEGCITRANEIRKETGLPPHPVARGAYEAVSEEGDED